MPMPRSVPAIENRPASKTISAGAASSASEAARRPFSMTVAAVARIAWPSEYRLRAPPVPPPSGIVSVSPWRTRTRSPGTPSRSTVSCT